MCRKAKVSRHHLRERRQRFLDGPKLRSQKSRYDSNRYKRAAHFESHLAKARWLISETPNLDGSISHFPGRMKGNAPYMQDVVARCAAMEKDVWYLADCSSDRILHHTLTYHQEYDDLARSPDPCPKLRNKRFIKYVENYRDQLLRTDPTVIAHLIIWDVHKDSGFLHAHMLTVHSEPIKGRWKPDPDRATGWYYGIDDDSYEKSLLSRWPGRATIDVIFSENGLSYPFKRYKDSESCHLEAAIKRFKRNHGNAGDDDHYESDCSLIDLLYESITSKFKLWRASNHLGKRFESCTAVISNKSLITPRRFKSVLFGTTYIRGKIAPSDHRYSYFRRFQLGEDPDDIVDDYISDYLDTFYDFPLLQGVMTQLYTTVHGLRTAA